MSMSIEAIKARLAQLNQNTSKRSDIWKPKDKHTIRLLPYRHGDDPFVELAFHYEIGSHKGGVYCPKSCDGAECCICDFAETLRAWNDPATGEPKEENLRKQDFEMYKKIKAKERYYVPMIERGVDNPSPKFWSFGKMIYEELLKMCVNEEMNEDRKDEGGSLVLTSPESAYDITVDFKKPNNEDLKGNVKPFPITDINNKLKTSKLAPSKKEVDSLLDRVVNIKEVYPPLSSAEVEDIFNKFIGENASEVSTTEEGTKYEANSKESPVQGGQDIDAAFADIA